MELLDSRAQAVTARCGRGRRTRRVPGGGRAYARRADTKSEYFYIYAGDDPVNMTDPSGNLPVISQRQVRMICRRHPSECRGHKINWRSVGDFAKDLGKHILLGAAGGAVVGCGIGAGSMAELGPPGWIGGCIVVAPPGAVLGARYGVGEFLYPYVGPLGEALLVGG